MEKGKAVFVTVLIVVMLVAIDCCLYTISTSSFASLTGVLVIYGVLRLACDFYQWLCKSDSEFAQQAEDPVTAEPGKCNSQKVGKKPKVQRSEDGAIMKVLNEDV